VAAVACTAAVGGVGTLLFAATAASRQHPVVRVERGLNLGPMRWLGVRVVVFSFVGVGAMWGGMPVWLTAVGGDSGVPALASVGMAAYALGSIVGGLWASSAPAPRGARRRYIGTLLAATLLLVPLIAVDELALLIVALVIGGFPLAPAMGSAYELVGELSPPSMTTESFTWLGSAVFAGGAAGSALCGIIIDHLGPRAGAGLLVACCGAALATTMLGRRSLPRATAGAVT
jgi:MFS family permease